MSKESVVVCVLFAFLSTALLAALFGGGLAISGGLSILTPTGAATISFSGMAAFFSLLALITACCENRASTIALMVLCVSCNVAVLGLVGRLYIEAGIGYYLALPEAGVVFGTLAAVCARDTGSKQHVGGKAH